MAEKGTLYFFTGLAGAGKTTVGGLFYRRLKELKPDVIVLDGDLMRNTVEIKSSIEKGKFDPDDDRIYSTAVRKRGAMLTAPWCLEQTDAGKDIVLCSISMYKEVRDWYRARVENYKEIYVRVKMETLYSRNRAGLYSPGRRNVVGVDLPWDEPDSSDVVIDNDGQETPEEIVDRLFRLFDLDEKKA